MQPSRRAVALILALAPCSYAAVSVTLDPQASSREAYGAARLSAVLARPNIRVPAAARVLAATHDSKLLAGRTGLAGTFRSGETEAFRLLRRGNDWLIVGSDQSGVLYGCLELARRTAAAKSLPEELDFTDRPAFRIRGTNLFWMKRGYNWPVTPENFPWFFDRALMTRYLDELVENRYNALFFWNGHPFPYFLKLSRYPEARMLGDSELERNIAHLKWFTEEADRRGIWTVFHFYNIHVSPNFAQAHEHEGVRVSNAASTPLLAAYTRYCISEFINSYPSVGLMLTAGEALNVKREEFVRDTIIPGITDTGRRPPLIIREWTIDPIRYRDVIQPNYDNLFTMMKHNTEMLVSPHPDPRNQTWISYGQSHIINLHELGDLKPFRWGSPIFIQQTVKTWRQIGAAGYHVYPMTSWQWPQALDRTEPTLSTIDRDRIWLEAFGRYGWNPDRPAIDEEQYWRGWLKARFGSAASADAIYGYYVTTGPIVPGLQNVVNIFNMNYHPTALSQEATLNGILHSERWEAVEDNLARPLDDLTLTLYEKRFGKLTAEGRLRPPLSIKEFLEPHEDAVEPLRLSTLFVEMADRAVKDLESTRGAVTSNAAEYDRFINDGRSILRLARFYRAKLEAATHKARFDREGDFSAYAAMLAKTAESVEEYRKLDELASTAYTAATDLGDWYRWETARKSFEEELAFYREQAALRETGAQLVYLGFDGPMNDASNAFHWALESARRQSGWSAQSYAFGENPFQRAKLVVVYDLAAPSYKRYAPQLKEWIRRGGRLLIFDPLARASADDLLSGLQFTADTSLRAPTQLAFAAITDPLLRDLAGTTIGRDAQVAFASSVRAATKEWRQLAYTVVWNASMHQFYVGYETYGPRWTSLMDPARMPVLLVRQEGQGDVAFAQLGAASLVPVATNVDQAERCPEYLRKFVANLIAWAKLD